jgi:hypothetical protein
MRRWIVIAAACCIGVGFAASIPAKDERGGTASHYHLTQSDQRGTRDNPLVIESHSAQPSKAEADNEQAEKDQHAVAESKIARGTIALACITGVLVVATIVLAVFTYLLWDEAKQARTKAIADSIQQGKDMRDSIAAAGRSAVAMEGLVTTASTNAEQGRKLSHQHMRAYIAVDLTGATYQQNTIRFAGNPTFHNTGFTPARNIKFWIKADVFPTELPDDFVFPEGTENETDIGLSPRQTHSMQGVVESFYPDPEASVIREGAKKRLYCWGRIRYDDVFGDQWVTEFCQSYWFFPNPSAPDKNLLWSGIYHRSHNSST